MMNKHDKQRCDILFEESIKSKYTKIGYTWQLQQFMIILLSYELQFLIINDENYLNVHTPYQTYVYPIQL